MLTEPLVLRDTISKKYQEEIEYRFIGENTLPWYFTHETTQENEKVETASVMFHMFQYYRWGNSTSQHFDFIKPLLYELIEKSGTPFTEFLQVRAVCQFPIITERQHNLIHTDLADPVPYHTGVYYVNDDVDGDTIIFNETFHDVPPDQVIDRYKSFTLKQRVTPSRGGVVMFPGYQYHSSSLPTKKVRCILNFSWR